MPPEGGGPQARTPEGRARKLLKSFAFLSGGRLSGEGFTFLLFVVLSRVYGQEGIGEYSFSIGFTGFFAVFCDFGLYFWAVKELSRIEGDIGPAFGPMVTLRLILSALVFGALLLVTQLLPLAGASKHVILLIGVFQMLQRMLGGATAVFVAREDTHLMGLFEASQKALSALAAIALAALGAPFVYVVAALPTVTVVVVVAAYLTVFRRYGRPHLVVPLPRLVHAARQTLPYGLSGLSTQIYMRADVVIIGFLLGTVASGSYNVAYRVAMLAMLLPQFVSLALLPVASRLFHTSREELSVLFHRGLGAIVLLALPLAGGIWLVADDVIVLLFGSQFESSVPVLRILAGLVVLHFVSATFEVFLLACDQQVARTKIQWFAASVNVCGNLVLIPLLGIAGAAIATVCSEAVMALLYARVLHAYFGAPRVGGRLLLSGAAVLAFCLLFTQVVSASIWLVVPASALLYLAIVALSPETRRNELQLLLGLLRRDTDVAVPLGEGGSQETVAK